MTPTREHLDWPFFSAAHRDIIGALDRWIAAGGLERIDRRDPDAAARAMTARLGEVGLTRAAVPALHGGLTDPADTRLIALTRETLAWHDGLADFAFANQCLGSTALALSGSDETKAALLPRIARGEVAVGMTLPETVGTEAAAVATTARPEGDDVILDGGEVWVAGAGSADVWCVFTRTSDSTGGRGLTAFLVLPGDPGATIGERMANSALQPHATLSFKACRLPANRRVGPWGGAARIALACIDLQRIGSAAAAVGLARRAIDEAVAQVVARRMETAAAVGLHQAHARIGAAVARIECAQLATYRAAWGRDQNDPATTRSACVARLAAVEAAREAVDVVFALAAAQDTRVGSVIERLGREVRCLDTADGGSDLQKALIGRPAARHIETASPLPDQPVPEFLN